MVSTHRVQAKYANSDSLSSLRASRALVRAIGSRMKDSIEEVMDESVVDCESDCEDGAESVVGDGL